MESLSLSLTNSTNRLFMTTNLNTTRTTYLLATLNPLACCMGNVSCCLLCKQLLAGFYSNYCWSSKHSQQYKETKKCVAFLFQNWHWCESWELEEIVSLLPSFHLCIAVKLKGELTFLTPFLSTLLFNEMRITKNKNKQPVRIGFAFCSEFNSLRLHSNWNKKKYLTTSFKTLPVFVAGKFNPQTEAEISITCSWAIKLQLTEISESINTVLQ